METHIELGDIQVHVVLKDIQNIHLSVYPPDGAVRISAPAWMNLDAIRVFAISKLGWIKRQQQKLQAQERETPREYLDRESHYVWGERYLLQVVEANAAPVVELQKSQLVLHIRPGSATAKKHAILEAWYREQLKRAALPLIAQWEPQLGVNVAQFFVQRMKTRWGSCNPGAGNIRLNTELAKKPPACLEYVIVHELLHLLEPTHNARFVALLDRFMPNWQFHRDQLNRFPVSHEEWEY